MPSFTMSRSTHVDADPAPVRALLEDFREWRTWSPWEEVDPDLQRSHSGPVYFDKAIGKDFEKGLAQLRSAAESSA